ncbi:FAD-binding oxidoreductase [Staphylococcus equorum]|uniref:FAD-binding oxidoreductase n=1 Tax=Staphylococcus equorum TaxID=246432 RepID=A0A9X4R252_9STAP|nr:FAD-dependent oxidoreductase [Staphylococcus equorum]MDG0841830.1 FAD-binding oxidoreductase [Staphylococcus equorum]MDG0858118.1 FAD-binding oxidoreductase [Staphylococcus equorum]
MYDVIIIGSGVMGMSVARELSKSDSKVAVIDRDIPGEHASFKAGGMLGAQNEFTEDSDLFHIARQAQEMFEPLRDSLLDEVGLDIEYLHSGLIKLASSIDDNACVEKQYKFLHQYNPAVELLPAKSLKERTNGNVISDNLSAMYIPNDNQINANKYTKALLKSLEQRGIQRIYNTEVSEITPLNPGYRVVTHTDVLTAEKVVVAGGAWSGKLLNRYIPNSSVRGVKGEVLLVNHPNLSLETTLFTTDGCYVVPKMKNRYLIGATSYFDDYSVGVSRLGKNWLIQQATSHIPNLREGKLIKQWSGVRPYTSDEKPIMDEVEKNLFIISGHYRNGILLSPYVGKWMSDWIQHNRKPEQFADFIIERGKTNEVHYKR